MRLLIPGDHTPNTIAAHPTFFFYSEFKRVSFVISAPGRSEPLYEREILINTSRVVRVEIPETAPPLEVGQEYVWTVVARCPSAGEIYARASLRRVELRNSFNLPDGSELSGESGTIKIASLRIYIDDRAFVRVTNLGTGDAGSIVLSGELIRLTNGGSITAETLPSSV